MERGATIEWAGLSPVPVLNNHSPLAPISSYPVTSWHPLIEPTACKGSEFKLLHLHCNFFKAESGNTLLAFSSSMGSSLSQKKNWAEIQFDDIADLHFRSPSAMSGGESCTFIGSELSWRAKNVDFFLNMNPWFWSNSHLCIYIFSLRPVLLAKQRKCFLCCCTINDYHHIQKIDADGRGSPLQIFDSFIINLENFFLTQCTFAMEVLNSKSMSPACWLTQQKTVKPILDLVFKFMRNTFVSPLLWTVP